MPMIYSYCICQDSYDILKQLAEEDHMSQLAELECLISAEYKRRQEAATSYVVSIPAGSDVTDLKL